MADGPPDRKAPDRGRHGVLQVVTSTDRRGAEVSAVELGEALERRGCPVDTVALWPGSSATRVELATLGRRRHDPMALAALARRARRSSVVVGHGSSTLPFGAAGCASTRTPFVYRSIGDPTYWASSAGRRARVRLALRRARVVVAIWPGAAEALVRLYGLRADRVEVIPNGVPADRFVPTPRSDRAPRRRDLGAAVGAELPSDAPVVAYLGALSAEKDPVLAVAAMAHLPDVHLVVAGSGPLDDEVRRQAGAVAGGRVHVVGPMAEPALLLAACDALVVPSRTEGIPAVTIEAGLAGLPVVACAVGGVADVVEDGRTGRLVADRRPGTLAAALQEVLDPATGDEMGRAARERCVDRFGLDAVAERWVALLGRVGGTVP